MTVPLRKEMLLLYLLIQNCVNTRKRGESLNVMSKNVNLFGQAIIESRLYPSFQR